MVDSVNDEEMIKIEYGIVSMLGLTTLQEGA